MRSLTITAALLLALPAAALGQTPEAAPARDTTAAKAAPANPADTTLSSLTALAGMTLSGYAEASYSYSNRALGEVIPGRLYDRYQNQFTLDAVKLVLDKPYATDRFDAGFHTDLLFGQDASVLHSTGLALGDQGDITQLYVTLNIPTPNGNGVQLKAGKMVTLLGLEVLEAPLNPNWSEGNQFVYVENFTNVGLSVEYKFSKYADTQLRVINGWDVAQDNNNGKSYMGRLGLYPDDRSSIGIVGYWGPEETGTTAPKRMGGELLLNRQLTDKVAAWIQADYGAEDANAAFADSTRAARWWGVGGWLALDLAPKAQLALRGDYVNDENGVRTSGVLGFPVNGGQKISSATATLNVKTWPHALVRPEVRYDHSTFATAYGGKANQVTFALSAAYIY